MLTYRESLQITGGLSRPSKMPCPAWSISQAHCITGARQAEHAGTVCSKCYAARGRYQIPNVQRAMERRLAGLEDPRWVEAMIQVIQNDVGDYFRWFDSGDLQSYAHLIKIIEIAKKLKSRKFWLPTQEQAMVQDVVPPKNLTIRVTAPKINPVKLPDFKNTAVVLSGFNKQAWEDKLQTNSKDLWYCPADGTRQHKCGDCRACWDKSIKTIAYRGK